MPESATPRTRVRKRAPLFDPGDFLSLGRILHRDALDTLPTPEPLIAGWLSLRTYALLVGAGGVNKTFTALGMSCAVATGQPWLGIYDVVEAPVIYVVGEGASGLKSRIAAWEQESGVRVPRDSLTVLMKPDPILGDKRVWRELRTLAGLVGARLVVFDTLSSLAAGMDETADAPKITRELSDLAEEINGTTLAVHHTGWGPQTRARGSSAWEHNADEVLVLTPASAGEDADTHEVVLRRKKVKDGRDGDLLGLTRVELGPSCVLKESEGVAHRVSVSASEDQIRGAVLQYVSEHEWAATERRARDEVAALLPGTGEKRVRPVLAALLSSGDLQSVTRWRENAAGVRRRDGLLGLRDSEPPTEVNPGHNPDVRGSGSASGSAPRRGRARRSKRAGT